MSNIYSRALLAAMLSLPCGAALAQDAGEQIKDAAETSVEKGQEIAADAAKAVTDAADKAEAEMAATKDEGEATEAKATESEQPAQPEGEAPAPSDEAADDAPQVGAYYGKSTHNDWMLRCIKTPDGNDPCELYQLLKTDEGVAVAEVTMIPLRNGGKAVAGVTVVSPLETDLTAGLIMQVDKGEARGYPFNFCAPVGCVSRMGLSQGELNAMKRGANATLRIQPYGVKPEEAFNLTMSLSGFTAAYNELVEVTDALVESQKSAE